MSLKIKRSTGYFSSTLSFTILLNGELIGKIESNQEENIVLEHQTNYLTVKTPMTKSKTIQVKPGDYVQIVDNKLPLYLIGIFFIFLLFLPIFSLNLSPASLPFALSLIFLIGISIIVYQYFKPYFKLEISTRELRR